MTASEILRIALTVGFFQILCDVAAYLLVFSRENYQVAVASFARAKSKLEKEKAAAAAAITTVTTATASKPSRNNKKVEAETRKKSSGKSDKVAKRVQQAEDDYSDALRHVVGLQFTPGLWSSLLFALLLRVMGTELKGSIVGILPFIPHAFFRRITSRGIEFADVAFEPTTSKVTDASQACSFMFIFFLASIGVKPYVASLFATSPPPGAEGIMSLINSPKGQRALKSMGVETETLDALQSRS